MFFNKMDRKNWIVGFVHALIGIVITALIIPVAIVPESVLDGVISLLTVVLPFTVYSFWTSYRWLLSVDSNELISGRNFVFTSFWGGATGAIVIVLTSFYNFVADIFVFDQGRELTNMLIDVMGFIGVGVPYGIFIGVICGLVIGNVELIIFKLMSNE